MLVSVHGERASFDLIGGMGGELFKGTFCLGINEVIQPRALDNNDSMRWLFT